ncbi:MAG: hypothetical protein ABI645_12330 [Pseudomonadota bacterium]
MKKSIILLSLGFVPTVALSGDAISPIIDDLASCVETLESSDRLTCFDQLAARFVTRGGARAPSTTGDLAAVSKAESRSFGEVKLSGSSKTVVSAEEEKMRAHIAGLRFVPPDVYVVTLDNGQAWRHQDSHQAEFLREGDAITITRAALGTYRLTRDAGRAKNWIRVTRFR